VERNVIDRRSEVNWIRIIEAGVAASILASFSDWYFFGILFHTRYHREGPGIWRKYKDKKDEMRSIFLSTIYQSITCFVFVIACRYLGITILAHALFAAGVAWFMLPLPLLLSQANFIRIDRMIIFSHSVGWLARLLISAMCVAWLL
jgi:hypothetical protein